jgi:hypothetical protein
LLFSPAKGWERYSPHNDLWRYDTASTSRQVSGHDFTGVPGKPAFGLLGWLVRLARDDPELVEGGVEGCEVVPYRLPPEQFLAPQARAQLLPTSRGPQHARFSRVGWNPGFGLLGRNAAKRAKKSAEGFDPLFLSRFGSRYKFQGNDFTGVPGKPAFGLLGWLVRLARDDPELVEGESRAANGPQRVRLSCAGQEVVP